MEANAQAQMNLGNRKITPPDSLSNTTSVKQDIVFKGKYTYFLCETSEMT